MGAARPSAGVAALNGSFVEFDGSGALGQEQSAKHVCWLAGSGWFPTFSEAIQKAAVRPEPTSCVLITPP